MKTCSRCGASLPDDETKCTYCGKSLIEEEENTSENNQKNDLFCKNCGGALLPGDQFCTKCGTKVESINSNQETNNFGNNFNNSNPVNNPELLETSTIGICSIVFGVLIPIVGLILGIVGLSKYKVKKNRTLCIIGIVVSIVIFVINYIYLRKALDEINNESLFINLL